MLPIPPSNPSLAETHAWFHAEDVIAEAAAQRLVLVAGLAPRRGRPTFPVGLRHALASARDCVWTFARHRQPAPAATLPD